MAQRGQSFREIFEQRLEIPVTGSYLTASTLYTSILTLDDDLLTIEQTIGDRFNR